MIYSHFIFTRNFEEKGNYVIYQRIDTILKSQESTMHRRSSMPMVDYCCKEPKEPRRAGEKTIEGA